MFLPPSPLYFRLLSSNWFAWGKKHTVSSRVGTPSFLREAPSFWVPSSFWSKFKKLIPFFWEPSKLVHANCMKHFKMKELHFVLIENIIVITLYTFRLHSVFTTDSFTAWKVSKYGVISGPYFPAFGPEITPYLDTFHAVFG